MLMIPTVAELATPSTGSHILRPVHAACSCTCNILMVQSNFVQCTNGNQSFDLLVQPNNTGTHAFLRISYVEGCSNAQSVK